MIRRVLHEHTLARSEHNGAYDTGEVNPDNGSIISARLCLTNQINPDLKISHAGSSRRRSSRR